MMLQEFGKTSYCILHWSFRLFNTFIFLRCVLQGQQSIAHDCPYPLSIWVPPKHIVTHFFLKQYSIRTGTEYKTNFLSPAITVGTLLIVTCFVLIFCYRATPLCASHTQILGLLFLPVQEAPFGFAEIQDVILKSSAHLSWWSRHRMLFVLARHFKVTIQIPHFTPKSNRHLFWHAQV